MYDTTAFLYEQTAAFEQPQATCDLLCDVFTAYHISPSDQSRLGDLGSGTGLMAIMLAERGWQVTGIERSHAMLEIAQNKSSQLPQPVQARLQWQQGDITHFSGHDHDWDGAICLCNTVNHLTTADALSGFAAAVHAALKPGGILIFDSDTLSTFYRFFHHEPTVVFEDATHRLTRACHFNAETGEARHLAVLARRTDAGWQVVSEEPMGLQYYAEEKILEIFSAQGFQLKAAEPFNPNPRLYEGETIPKILWTFAKH